MKRLLISMLAGVGLFVTGCSCYSWTSFWGGNPAAECADHWHWSKKEPMKHVEPAPAVAMSPCAAPSMAKAMQSYPLSGAAGSAVRLEKMAPMEVRANEPFDYQIKVTNLTDGMLQNVMVKDCMPKTLAIKSSVPKVDKMESGEVHWMLGTLGPNDSKMITVSAVAEGEGSITSCAEVSYDSPICAKINIVEPKIQLAKFAPSEVLKCDRIPLRYVVTNTGTGFACDIKIKDSLPEGLVTSERGREVLFELASLGPGKSQEFNKMVDATKTGEYATRAIATSRGSGRVESNLATTNVRQPLLAINESCPKDQYIGRSLTYDITVTNKGDGVANNTVIEAVVPEQTKFDRATEGGRFSHASPGKVQWNIGTLAPNTSKAVSMTVRGEQVGSFQTTAMVKAHCADSVSASCRTSLSGIPAILLEVVDVSDPIEVGKSETYVISVTNQGSAADTNIRVSCMLEDNMQYVSSSGPTMGSLVGNRVTFGPLPSLAPKAQARWRVNVKALGEGDMRFRVIMNSEQLERSVEETEATRFYQ